MPKKCLKCGIELSDTAYTCYGCGAAQESTHAQSPLAYSMSPLLMPEKTNSHRKFIAILLIAIIIVCVIGGAIIYTIDRTPPVVTLTEATTTDNTTYSVSIITVDENDSELYLGDYKIEAYKDGVLYGTLFPGDEMVWESMEYHDGGQPGSLSDGDTITIQVDGTSAEWSLKILTSSGIFYLWLSEYTIGSQSWHT